MLVNTNIKLSEEQEQAYAEIMDYVFNGDSSAYVLSGVAGSGKTTLLSYILKHLDDIIESTKIACITFTGRAATVISGKIPADLRGLIFVGTIHSFLYEATYDRELEKLVFNRRPKDVIRDSVQLIVVDEAQMVSAELFEDIIELGIPTLFLGDKEQLPPISEVPFNVMDAANFHMTSIQRQAEQSDIIRLSKTIRETGSINKNYEGKDVRFIKKSDIHVDTLKGYGVDVILTGTNKERRKYNNLARFAYGFSGDHPMVGETVMCLMNGEAADGKYIANGQRFIVRDVADRVKTAYLKRKPIEYRSYMLQEEQSQGMFHVNIPEMCWDEQISQYKTYEDRIDGVELSIFTYGYAMSVWKACGSEFDNVLFVDENVDYFCSRKKFRYTAVTRAKTNLIVAR